MKGDDAGDKHAEAGSIDSDDVSLRPFSSGRDLMPSMMTWVPIDNAAPHLTLGMDIRVRERAEGGRRFSPCFVLLSAPPP